MSVLTKAKQFLAQKATATAAKAADGIAAASELSPRQIAEIEDKRQAYLAQTPNMTDAQARSVIQRNLGAIGIEVYQEYLPRLKNIYCPVNLAATNFDPLNRIRYFDITKWVSFSDEQSIDKLVSVYHVLSAENCNIALIYQRTKEKCNVTLAVANTDADQSDPAEADAYLDRIIDALRGNFPGVEIKQKAGKNSFGCGLPKCLQNVVKISSGKPIAKSVATVSNLASEKSKEFISQSMEKLLDGIVPRDDSEAYTIVLLATPVLDIAEKRNQLLEIKTMLSPYESYQINDTISEADTQGAGANFGANLGANIGVHDESGFYAGMNFGVQFGRAANITKQVGKMKGVTQSFTNYTVKHALKVIDNQIERLDESAAMGMWDFCAYVISESAKVAANAAHNYFSLTQGEKSHMTAAAIHLWDGRREGDKALPILESIQKIQHPVFSLMLSADKEQLMYPTLVTPSARITGRELARALNFPRKSISGLPVLESVPFGREVRRYGSTEHAEREIVMGHIQHMGQTEETPISLNVDSLASHVFITGSTGAGKSNAVYQILDELSAQNVRFLVIEPAKGEYKQVFGGREDAAVYGTNFKKAPLLRMNPFSFPADIHVLEHIDRLVEIFNACWPMYAAMPAVLKDAVEQAYRSKGWDLSASRNVFGVFPTFEDLNRELPEVMKKSAYSADTKSDYVGALVTRVKSLTNGINGQIFCSGRELPDEALFDQNVIVDLSRVGSQETKSLLMGILVMKLQEYRMSNGGMNSSLRHVTVLEEAHNLLRRTSDVQTQEGSNLQGKSVEMIANAIAEMRTYGEGFVIADQAPDLMDPAVIRNTNTKIILRLPDQSDRELVGKAASLNDEQIAELAKLPRGVAAVYQNDWLEPVLCKVDLFDREQSFSYDPRSEEHLPDTNALVALILRGREGATELSKEQTDRLKDWIDQLDTGRDAKELLRIALSGRRNLTEQETGYLLYCVAKGRALTERTREVSDFDDAPEKIERLLADMFDLTQDLAREVRIAVFQYAASQMEQDEAQCRELLQYGRMS